MTDAHHYTAERDQRRGGEAELVRAEQSADDHVAAGLELAVHLDSDAAAKIVEDKNLVGFGQAQLPGNAGMLDARQGGGARAAIMAADQNHVGMRLGDAGGDRAHAYLRHQLDADAGVMVRVLEIVNQLRQIFNRVNIMMRRWGDQPDAGSRVADLGNPGIDLVAGKLAAFARLGALGHFDLQLFGVDQILAGDAEPAGGDLLDSAVARVAIGIEGVSGGVLTALAGVALAADAVHGDGQSLVGFLADRAVRHGPRLKTLHDRFDRLDFVDWNWVVGEFQVEESAQSAQSFRLVVDQLAVLLEDFVIAGAASVLELVNGLRVEQMVLAVAAPLILTPGIEQVT